MGDKRKAWLEEYFKCGFNATEAARRVGYKWPEKNGPRNKKLMQAEIGARLDEMIMSSKEVLSRLGQMARADISEFVTDTGTIDWEMVHRKGWLIKKIIHHKGRQSIIELHDAATVLMHLDRQHGGPDGEPLEHVVRIVGGINPDEI